MTPSLTTLLDGIRLWWRGESPPRPRVLDAVEEAEFLARGANGVRGVLLDLRRQAADLAAEIDLCRRHADEPHTPYTRERLGYATQRLAAVIATERSFAESYRDYLARAKNLLPRLQAARGTPISPAVDSRVESATKSILKALGGLSDRSLKS